MSRKPNSFRKIICEICGNEFLGSHSNAKYCSAKCGRIGERKSWIKYNQKNKQRRLKYSKEWYQKNKEKRTLQISEYQKTENGKLATKKSDENQRQKWPHKYIARQEVLKALRKRILIKKPCEVCGELRVEAHHDDYSKPLEVIWLCKKHHEERDLLLEKAGA